MNLADQYSVMTKYVDDINEFVSHYHAIVNAQHFSGFFTDSFWEKLPSEFQSQLLSDFDSLSQFFRQENPSSTFGTCTHAEPLYLECIYCFFRKASSLSLFHGTELVQNVCNSLLHNSSKKNYEVGLLSQQIISIAESSNTDRIVDVGSGIGYLDHCIVSSSDYRVIGLEISSQNAHKAEERFDQTLIRGCKLCKHIRNENKGQITDFKCNHESSLLKFRSIAHKVDPTTDLDSIVDSTFHPVAGYYDKFILAGLHTCGNLSSDVLRLFASSQKATALCLVPCCYNLMSEYFSSEKLDSVCEDATPGFPLSRHLYSLRCSLGYDAKQWAAQNPFSPQESSVRLMFYRALLQKLLIDHYGYIGKGWDIGRATKKMKQNFPHYISGALTRLKTKLPTPPPDIWTSEMLEEFENIHIEGRKQLEAFHYIRLQLSPCLESLIILDKCMFLVELGICSSVKLVKIFDPALSPRCLALVAFKK